SPMGLGPCGYSDADAIHAVLTSPDVLIPGGDDWASISRLDARRLITSPAIRIFMPQPETVFLFVRKSAVMWEIHVGIKKGSDREKGIASAVESARWMIENEGCRKLISYIPAFHKASLVFAKMCGMIEEGRLVEAHLQDDVLHDLVVMGATEKRLKELYGGN
ncbi:MAG: GNAT family N-acetyltransferase, partial [Desulfobulbaceae bacterium]|nr:GNAT family N-acetyltransferase [Desulfobulbaceae bacterium]